MINTILMKLYQVGKDNNETTNTQDRQRVAQLLFDAYRALNGCLLSKNQITKFIYPGMNIILTQRYLVYC